MGTLRASQLDYHGANAYQVVTLPAAAQAGDLLISIAGDRFLPSYGSGWTTASTQSGQNQSGKVAWRILTGADIGGGTYTVIYAGSGTGSVASIVITGGTFDPNNPIAGVLDDISPDINEMMPYLPINTGQTVFQYANGRTTAPGTVLSSKGALLYQRTADPDCESALYADYAISETTVNTVWTATTATNGSYKASVIASDPVGNTVAPPLTSQTYMLVASYDVAPVSPVGTVALITQSPTLVVYADGHPAPFHVQFQVSSKTDFSSINWSVELTGINAGEISAQVGVGLPDNHVYYWRARAGDGTTWGPWCQAQSFLVQMARSEAHEYLYENVGGQLASDPRGSEFVYENVGLPSHPVDIATEYVFENVGFLGHVSPEAHEYVYENAYSGIPSPFLWFVYRTYGFANDHVFIYGQGLGTQQGDYHATLYMDYGPDYTLTDVRPAIFDWSVTAVTTDSYGPGRKIFPGTDTAPPIVNIEADVVELIVPSGVSSQTVVTDYFYLVTDGGTSNRLSFLLYPVVDVPMAPTAGNNVSGTAVRIGGVPQSDGGELEQRYSAFDLSKAYVISSSFAERLPEFLCTASSAFSLTGGTPTTDLDDPVHISVPLTLRWRPLDSAVVARPDIGTGVSLWTPQQASTQAWEMYADNAPYVDPAASVASRNGDITRPAMVFPGDASLQLVNPVASGPSFSLVMALQLSATQDPKTTILSTFVTTPDPGTYPLTLELQGDVLTLRIGAAMASIGIANQWLGHRALVVGFSTDGTNGSLYLASDRRYTRNFTHKAMTNSGIRLYLGRTAEPLPQTGQPRMQILDLAYSASKIAGSTMWSAINAFDSAYGVTP